MEIIKRGKMPSRNLIFECDNCGCIFKENKSKCSSTSQWGVMHDGLGDYNCKCPCCGDIVYGITKNGGKK